VERQHIIADDFFLKTDAPRALDATLFIEVDQIAQWDVFVEMDFVGIIHTAYAGSMRHRQILQGAFAAFVADGTVEGVTGQQELHDVFTRVGHLLRIGTDY
jgi:hypothetical protein